MRTETVVFIVVGITGVLALGAIGGAVDSPHADGASYEVTFPSDQFLIPQSERQSSPPLSRVSVGGQTLDLSGRTGWLPPLGGVVVLVLWALIAMRTIGGPAVVLMTITGVLLLALVLMIGPGGTPAGGAASTDQPLSWLDRMVFLLVGLVTVLSGVALFLPDDADVYTTQFALVPFLGDVLEDLWNRATSEAASEPVGSPDNEVYRVWRDFIDRYGPDEASRPRETLTPGDVARHAESAGAPTDAVIDLRHVFEAVRYGPDEPSEASITQAQRAWDRINKQAESGDACDDS